MTADGAIPSDVFAGVPPQQKDSAPADVFAGVRPMASDSAPTDVFKGVAPEQVNAGYPTDVFVGMRPERQDSAPTDVFAGTEPHHGPSDSLPSDVFAGVQPSAAQHGLANVVADKVNHLVEKVEQAVGAVVHAIIPGHHSESKPKAH
ncbi:hypothetical protein CHLRE_03g153450v5 [Chlamydomonas reinhardtii]|jgi:hypothetical protein|uniref:Uncharacterized protein n=1 Tax=Chlamydomonas reinhardtii TaxID=3055 RepID=A8J7P4_CHLRE|nr:uncharacterized protein CHLRE_03g153450v5 [Chlamydomonas reinhardtii]PNW84660.1 hypothetical protein CHLRE_03g153450v5 [Chlamydomonas reinhardtii]|eukprot:XP_001697556.1 predicted protein [Chlamydomonas reinhardtii]